MPVYEIDLGHTILQIEAIDENYLEKLLNENHGVSPCRFQRLKKDGEITLKHELGDSQRPARVLR